MGIRTKSSDNMDLGKKTEYIIVYLNNQLLLKVMHITDKTLETRRNI